MRVVDLEARLKALDKRAGSGRLSMSGAHRFASIGSCATSQPTWDHRKPLVIAHDPVPYFQGEWGSSFSSEFAWCLRWLATHDAIDPCRASEPATPRVAATQGFARKDRWVK